MFSGGIEYCEKLQITELNDSTGTKWVTPKIKKEY